MQTGNWRGLMTRRISGPTPLENSSPTHRFNNQLDVGKDNRRINPEAFHRFDRDLRGLSWGFTESEKWHPLMQRAILGHIASGLTPCRQLVHADGLEGKQIRSLHGNYRATYNGSL
jgi:hypothetical protein